MQKYTNMRKTLKFLSIIIKLAIKFQLKQIQINSFCILIFIEFKNNIPHRKVESLIKFYKKNY